MEGFDVRTLVLTNLLLSAILGFGLLFFAKTHKSFGGIRHIGFGYLFLALGFLLIGSRSYISDLYSVVLANLLTIIGGAGISLGLFRFFEQSIRKIRRFNLAILLVLVPLLSYFTFVVQNINVRIIIMSLSIGAQWLMVAYKLAQLKKTESNFLIGLLFYSFATYSVVFFLRSFLTSFEPMINSFMDAGFVHAFAMITFQMLIVITAFLVSWCASQRLELDLSIQATIDPLTKTYNRRALQSFAEREISRSVRQNVFLAVIMLDIDRFKIINDQYGHLTGDSVLKELSNRLKSNLRQHDLLARFGGEEFVLLLPDTDSNHARLIAEKLKVVVSTKCFIDDDEKQEFRVTASFGVASDRGRDLDWHRLISAADQALYRAKIGGRNQVQGDFDLIKLVAK